jgi:YVTN family beta-propeller protein
MILNTDIPKKYILLVSTTSLLIFIIILMPYPAKAIESSNGIVINPNTNKIYVSNGENKSVYVIDGKTDKVVMNVLLGKTIPAFLNVDPGTIVQVLGISAGIVTAIVGIVTYRQGVVTRRKDVLKDIMYPLIKEFDQESPEMITSKDILDDIPISQDDTTPEENIPYGFYDEHRLLRTLRNHHGNTEAWDKGDGIVRESFTNILDFLSKLESLISIKLVTREQLNYFDYYINKAAENNGVVNYVRIYKFPLYGKLRRELDCRLPLIDTGVNIERNTSHVERLNADGTYANWFRRSDSGTTMNAPAPPTKRNEVMNASAADARRSDSGTTMNAPAPPTKRNEVMNASHAESVSHTDV